MARRILVLIAVVGCMNLCSVNVVAMGRISVYHNRYRGFSTVIFRSNKSYVHLFCNNTPG